MNRKRLLPIQPDAKTAARLEIENHIEETIYVLVNDGWSEEDARAEALRRFGSITRAQRSMISETHAIERRSSFLDFINSIPSDVRYAWRGLVSNPMFAVIVIGMLGMGMGTAATGFTVVDSLLLRPLPYAEPDRLVEVGGVAKDNTVIPVLSPAAAMAAMQSNSMSVLKGFAFYDQRSYTLTGEGDATAANALAVSTTIIDVLGVRPLLGRGFDRADGQPGAHRAMVSYNFWKAHGGARDMVGHSIRLDGEPFDVIGILPRNFKYPVGGSPRDIWVALTDDELPSLTYVNALGRLADGVTLEAANARLAKFVGPEKPQPMRATLLSHWRGNPELVRGVWLLSGAIALMMLVAIVNAMNLILFRGADRTREIAVRIALGVSRLQILRLVLVENVLIALLSGATAVAVALLGVAGVNRRLPQEFAFSSAYEFQVSHRVLLFAFLLACAVGLLLGLLPALRALRLRDVSDELRASRGATRGDTWIARGLVVAEVALAVMLLTGAGLLAGSFMRLTKVDPGIDSDHLAIMTVSLPESRYPLPAARAQLLDRLEKSLESDPAIEAVTVSSGAPPSTSFSFGVALQREGGMPLSTDKNDDGVLPFITASPDFVKTTGVHMLNGRELADADVGTDNVLIDANLARALWGDDRAGRRFRIDAESKWLTAVGVYRHIHAMGLDDQLSKYSMIKPRNPAKTGSYMTVVVRPRGDAAAALPVMRSKLTALDADIPTAKLETAREAFSETVDKPRFLARVMTGLSTVALVLAAIGIYGVLSYSVARRRREMGIRMALGAPPIGLGWLFMKQGLLMALSGIVIGVVAGLWLVRFAKSLLYDMRATDPATFTGVAILLIIVAMIASIVPARVAGGTSPAEVLRSD